MIDKEKCDDKRKKTYDYNWNIISTVVVCCLLEGGNLMFLLYALIFLIVIIAGYFFLVKVVFPVQEGKTDPEEVEAKAEKWFREKCKKAKDELLS